MSKVTKLECPNCGAGLPAPDGDNSLLYCPYCATPLNYDRYDATFKIDKKVEKVTHKIDHAKIAELEYQERKEKRENKELLIIFLALLAPALIYGLWYFGTHFVRDTVDKSKAASLSEQGYVCPGKSAEDFEGEKVKSVVKQLKSVGFTNIEKVATGGGLAVWDWGEVTEVMIDGENNFGAYAYFPPDASIVVTYK